jgi:hypothetical protein
MQNQHPLLNMNSASLSDRLSRWRLRHDALAIALLVTLWLIFFWPLFTPNREHQSSLKQGDFSAQFVAFGGYQYARFSQGEVPLWNPYNNGGLPFIADTQAAVFYPPRLITIALCSIFGTEWTYHALELEMTFHVLFYTLTMYLLLRVMTGQVLAGLAAAIIGGYSGYMTGYPPLQLALLEAGVWLSPVIFGIYQATRSSTRGWQRWTWLVLSGWALGLSWMAGHPQTSWFLTYLMLGYFAFRCRQQRISWQFILPGVIELGMITGGVVAVTLLPGFEYLLLTSRNDLDFAGKSSGFPFRDVVQFWFPGFISLFSPLYIGLTGLILAVIAVWRGRVLERQVWFWGTVAAFALLFSFGGKTPLYHIGYELLPGLRFFRGQERFAYLVIHSLAILAGFGMAVLQRISDSQRGTRQLVIGIALLGIPVLILALADYPQLESTTAITRAGIVFVIVSVVLLWLLPAAVQHPRWHGALLVIAVVELFLIGLNAPSSYDPIPPDEQLVRNPLLDIPLADTDLPFRVDGQRVLGGNFGSLYGLADIQGISPLFLTGVQQIIEQGLPDEVSWELFSVRYVYSDWEALNVPGIVLAEGEDERGAVKLHQLTAQRPYAHLIYQPQIVDNDAEARTILADPTFNAREVILLDRDPQIQLPNQRPDGAGATITQFAPESLTVIVNTNEPAILSLAQVDYPGWYAEVNGQPAPILRAYGGLSAIAVPKGESRVTLVYNPLTYRIGAIISLITWNGLGILTLALMLRSMRRTDDAKS